jgi:hypothetical protein
VSLSALREVSSKACLIDEVVGIYKFVKPFIKFPRVLSSAPIKGLIYGANPGSTKKLFTDMPHS